METKKISVQRLGITVGVFSCIAMVLYFMVMVTAGFAHIPELRFLNYLIVAAGGAIAIKYYNTKTGTHIQYLQGITLSFISIMAAAVLFAVFIFFYFWKIDPSLLDVIRTDAPVMGRYLSPVTAAISVISEGFVAALILSFSFMQYFKDDTLHSPYKQRGMHTQAPEKE